MTTRYKEYLVWLKASRIKAGKIQKEYKSKMLALADEVAMRHKKYSVEVTEWKKRLEKEP